MQVAGASCPECVFMGTHILMADHKAHIVEVFEHEGKVQQIVARTGEQPGDYYAGTPEEWKAPVPRAADPVFQKVSELVVQRLAEGSL